MIKATELRIGNLVTVAHETNNPIVVVETITKNFINVFDNRSGYDLDFVLPIQLTEEWLVRFGFEKLRWDERVYKINVCGELFEYKFYKNGRVDCYLTSSIVERQKTIETLSINKIHKLQNLIFSITGEELTIKQ